jgi:hypothetical protein
MHTPWSSADLLSQFNRRTARIAGQADAILDDDKYDRLAIAQERVVSELALVAPQVLYPRDPYGYYPQLLTYDNQIFTFGSDDNGYPITPIGKVGIYASLAAIPDAPWRAGVDYLEEGTQIRLPNNRTYSGPLYWRGITQTPRLSAKQEPVLYPPATRELIVIDAVREFASEGNRSADLLSLMQDAWDRRWPSWCLVWRTQYRDGGGIMLTGRHLATLGVV